MTIDEVKDALAGYDGRELTLMEVCGSHTRAIAEYGIPGILSPKIRLLSGPGCPVCVTPSSYIDRLLEIGRQPGHVITTFGDLMRVPGSDSSLSEAKSEGVRVDMVYSPMQVVTMAAEEPEKTFVFAAVGFETTIPVYAALVDCIIKKDIRNIRLLLSLKTMPKVIAHLMEGGAAIDGFLAPGHVSVVTGANAFRPLAETYGIPFVVGGFEAKELLLAIYDLVRLQGQGVVKNDYPSVVTAEGNPAASELCDTYFTPADALWRGMGTIPGSGLLLKKEYRRLDMGSDALLSDHKKNAACICGQVLMGKKLPGECPLFAKACTPEHPQGACMVSGEGSCRAYFVYQR
ncbi:MAG: hydrogenase formation protein HypD [Lachnospiraceae bacterium]|nr:hydrogenase formation protein HypD [Lachnospiraceae bacterium]